MPGGTGGGGTWPRTKGKGAKKGAKGAKAPKQKLPKDQRPGLVDRLAVVVGVAFAASLAWQHLPV